MDTLAKSWIKAAIKGDSVAREQILKRIYPVTEGDQSTGKVVFEGIRLEVSKGKLKVDMGSLAVENDALPSGQESQRESSSLQLPDSTPVEVPFEVRESVRTETRALGSSETG